MIISLRWLSDFVDVQDYLQKPEALAEILTRAGLEVENITHRAKDFQFVVTGYILEKDKHPNADKLSLCRVTTGEGVVHQIVCGAQNHKAHDKVVVALPGAILPGNFAIKHSVIRGVESGGMLCSNKELGLPSESDGIVILPEDAPIGKSFAEFMGFDDVTFELKVTPNRADCLSHFGLAREVACLLGRSLKTIATDFKPIEKSTKDEVAVDVRSNELCPRYAGRFIDNVKVGPSPSWLQKRLESVGMNSINNIVDVTNYVMMELGQPLHAFDADEIKGRKIIVEKAQAQEKFKTLDSTELVMKGDELMIRDQERSVAIAGVVGGLNSGVTEKTSRIFLEAAFFNPMIVRKSSRSHGVNTDSGYRFSRGVDPNFTVQCMDRAVDLILKVAGGVAHSQHWDLYPEPIRKKSISISIDTISKRMGYVAEASTFKNFMERLGCQVEEVSSGEFKILPPTFRFDLEHEMDLVEEYARLHGYEHIPESIPAYSAEPLKHDAGYIFAHNVAQYFLEKGYQQAQNFAFTSGKMEKNFIGNPQLLAEFGFQGLDSSINLLNPLSDDLNVMRQLLSYQLFRNMTYNFHQGNELGRVFEIGKVFYRQGTDYKETTRLSVIAWGHHFDLWRKDAQSSLIYELKAALEYLFSKLQIQSYQISSIAQNQVPSFLHLGQAGALNVEGKKIGFFGALHPSLLDENKIRVPVVILELDLDVLQKGQPRLKKFESISKFPTVQRDLALVLNRNLTSGEVSKEIQKLAGPLLKKVEIFDLYEGEKLDKGQKSVAYRLFYQDKNATLQDDVVNKSIDSVLTGLKQKFSISVR